IQILKDETDIRKYDFPGALVVAFASIAHSRQIARSTKARRRRLLRLLKRPLRGMSVSLAAVEHLAAPLARHAPTHHGFAVLALACVKPRRTVVTITSPSTEVTEPNGGDTIQEASKREGVPLAV
ncbi:hypothetical protein ANCDUO_04739, partial [Ancylostoma duodenale]